MKRITRLLIIAASLTLLSALAAPIALAGRDPFIGAWESIDLDGSYQTLAVGGGPGNTYHIRYYDFGATVCGLDPDTGEILYAASARGAMTGSGDNLEGILPIYCHTHPPTNIGEYNLQFVYDAYTDTLISWGIVWNRR